jgi:hypothetical protein
VVFTEWLLKLGLGHSYGISQLSRLSDQLRNSIAMGRFSWVAPLAKPDVLDVT